MHPCSPGLSSIGELSDIATVVNEEAQLSAHIRHLLLDYVRRYITTDYLQYTQSAVAELVSLEPVPTHDPASLTLPTDPFTTLISLFKLGDLPSYQEKLVISQAARLLLKEVITLPKGKPRSERLVWSRDAWDEREDESLYPVEPILTRRAVRETPILGKTGGAHRCRETEQVKVNSYTSLVTSTPLALDSVNVQPIQEPDVNLDKVLDVTFHLKASEACRRPRTPQVCLYHVSATGPSTQRPYK
ncbi:hypothetical protein FPV67DRAFT_392206 [Lyophyllum atratum]|nr:hypothetical protein FPV67DRAFT_392206 [Lyophyllum atratum]